MPVWVCEKCGDRVPCDRVIKFSRSTRLRLTKYKFRGERLGWAMLNGSLHNVTQLQSIPLRMPSPKNNHVELTILKTDIKI